MTGSFILNGQNVYSRRGNWGEGNVACVFWVSLPVHVHHNDLLSSFSNAWWEFPLLDWLLATVCFSQSFYSAVLTSPPFGDSSVLQGKRTVLRVVNPAKVLKANLWNAICNNWEKAFWRQFPCQSKMFLLKRKILGGIIGKKKERGERERRREGRKGRRKKKCTPTCRYSSFYNPVFPKRWPRWIFPTNALKSARLQKVFQAQRTTECKCPPSRPSPIPGQSYRAYRSIPRALGGL